MATVEWTPDVDSLNSVVEVLRDSLVPDSVIQRQVQEKISLMQKHPDFISYLLYVLRHSTGYEEHVRALSAILLKNNIHATFDTLPPAVIDAVRQECLALMRDESKNVRASVTTLIGTLVLKGDISSWPDLIPYLCGLLDIADNQLSDTALSALFKICEEYLAKRGTAKEERNDTMNTLVTKFIALVTHPRRAVRRDAVKILNQAMQDNTEAWRRQFDSQLYLQNLFAIAGGKGDEEDEEDGEMEKLICQAFVIFVETRDAAILPQLHNVAEYILQKSEHEDAAVALQACEFWLATAKLPNSGEILLPLAARLLPILFKNMRYSEYELCALRDLIGVDEHVEDKSEDIRPFAALKAGTVDAESDSDDVDYGEGYEQADALGDTCVGWTLRKCSAATLDALAVQFGDDLLPAFFPLVNTALNHEDWLVKESGILALGAIAEGCLNGLRAHLPHLVQYLLACMNDAQSLIRVITCWALSRFMPWVMEEPVPDVYFVPVMSVLLKHFLDGNKRVQRAALSAFCIFQEEARLKLVPYIEFILHAFATCFNKYKFRSYLILYDAIGVLAQSTGAHLNQPEYVALLLAPLMHKLDRMTHSYDEQFMALMECLASIAIGIEHGFLPYAHAVYERCLSIINETVTAAQCHMENPNAFELPDKDPMCAAHDMILGLAIGLKADFAPLVTGSNLVQQMYYTLQDEHVQIRQPALAIYGELIKICYDHLAPSAAQYLPIVIQNVDKRYEVACNNAAWVIGKMGVAMGVEIEPYASKIVERFVEIMATCNGTKTMYQTVAIALCTLGLVCPDAVAPHFGAMLRPCCQAMRNVGDCEEKDVGFRGLCELVMRNPAAAAGDFVYFCDAIASWSDIRPDLKETIANIVACFRGHCGEENWARFYEQFPPILKVGLNRLYGI